MTRSKPLATKMTRKVRKDAEASERENDALALRSLVYQCCDEIERLSAILRDVGDHWLDWGPTDDGTPEGERFEETLGRALWANGKPKRRGRR